MVSASPVYDYCLGSDGVILSVSDDWLKFACVNQAPELTRDVVVGRNVWEFVAGDSTRELYQMMFRRVLRSEQSLVVPFRCDSPDRFRFMKLAIEPTSDQTLQLSGLLVREQSRPRLKLLDRFVERSSQPLGICSVCLRVQIFEEKWIECDQAVDRLDLFHSSELPLLDYRVCPECVALATAPRNTVPGAGA